MALALWLLSRASTSDGRRLLLMYMAPTNAMAREFHDLLRRAQLEPGRVSLMGGGEKKESDLLAAHLEGQAKAMMPDEHERLQAIDKAIKFVELVMSANVSEVYSREAFGPRSQVLVHVICHLLTVRHHFLGYTV